MRLKIKVTDLPATLGLEFELPNSTFRATYISATTHLHSYLQLWKCLLNIFCHIGDSEY